MKKSIPSILFCLAATTIAATINPTPAAAQNEIKIENVDATNLGDGRILFRNEDETPLNGSHRLIDGYRSEFIVAEFTDGFFNGDYEHHRNNALLEKGTYKNGVKHGLFTEYYSDGTTPKNETPITDGKVDGVAKSYRTDGSLETEKGYKNGKEHGPDRAWRSGEEKPYRDHNYLEGVPDGRQYSEITSNTGDYTEIAHFDKGKPVGEFLQTWNPSGDVRQRGSYGPGGKQGVWVEIRRDGKIESESTWADGKLPGDSKTFFTDNSVEKITPYKDGKREGVEKTFRFDGGRIASEFTWAADVKEGEYRYYYDDEKPTLKEEGRIHRGTEVLRKEYYDNGKLRRVQERPASGGVWKTIESYDRNGKREEQ
jgi:antitoxin component YwqK of YwqJK toxin-antitoxin module